MPQKIQKGTWEIINYGTSKRVPSDQCVLNPSDEPFYKWDCEGKKKEDMGYASALIECDKKRIHLHGRIDVEHEDLAKIAKLSYAEEVGRNILRLRIFPPQRTLQRPKHEATYYTLKRRVDENVRDIDKCLCDLSKDKIIDRSLEVHRFTEFGDFATVGTRCARSRD